MFYLTLKALHIFFVLIWVSGMVVQALTLAAARKLPGPALPQELLRLRQLHKWERRLTTPAMVLALGSGTCMAYLADWFGGGWLSAKLGLVLVLGAVHGIQAGKLKRRVSVQGRGAMADTHSTLPLVLGTPLVIIFLVVFKPF